MSQSQALGSEGPTGLLFLSDEQVQIPAVLTASAWENLQDREDRECFSSLRNTTVGIQDYKLQFHKSSEQTRSHFYLLVGKLVTTAVGVRDNTPSCTSLPSVQAKICQTWRAMLGEEDDSQKIENPFNLTDLLGEWQQDCLKSELKHVREKLSHVNPESSSSSITSAALPDTCTGTGWDIDNVRYKKMRTFCVPVQLLLIPDTGGQQHLPAPVENVMNSQSEISSESTNVQGALPKPELQSTGADGPNSIQFAPVVLSAADMCPMSNPWDMCPPPSNTSSTNTSPETTPVPHSPTGTTTNLCPLDTSTQMSAPSKESQTELTTDPSLFPPYQRPLASISRQSANAFSGTSRNDDLGISKTQEPLQGEPSRKCKKSLRKEI
ncbi:hypothetical protein WMY93_024047 [Mugilogobius chulae]|uniref:Shelterin complex subunit TPP1/Est3 domain-containing protein n=1 Tax=Mugilogobius chulae TaxID=88201 RepID=A0AAW0NCY6_9GOBI